MSKEKRCPACGAETTMAPEAPSRLPVSVERGLGVEELRVVEWFDTPQPTGRPHAVALLLQLAGADTPIVVRMKTAAYVDWLIRALETHRAGVWPEAKRSR